MIKASELRKKETENENGEELSPISSLSRSQLLKIVTTYLRGLLPTVSSKRWTISTVWRELQEAYLILPRSRIVIPDRKMVQVTLYKQCPSLVNPMPYSAVNTLAQIIQCQANRQVPVPEGNGPAL